MKRIDINRITEYIEINIDRFHQKRLLRLEQLSLHEILKRKNPYLFRVKNLFTAADLVKSLVDAFLQSQEETMFGDFIEGLAIFISQDVNGGYKSTSLVGIDLEFERKGIYYIVEIKSGPNWGNSSQIKKMKDNFEAAKRLLSDKNVIAVNGCCYGKDNQPNKGSYLKLCGQRFWAFISEDESLYINLIEPLGHKAKEKNEQFQEAYGGILNRFVASFVQDFCQADGRIDWAKLVAYNAAKS